MLQPYMLSYFGYQYIMDLESPKDGLDILREKRKAGEVWEWDANKIHSPDVALVNCSYSSAYFDTRYQDNIPTVHSVFYPNIYSVTLSYPRIEFNEDGDVLRRIASKYLLIRAENSREAVAKYNALKEAVEGDFSYFETHPAKDAKICNLWTVKTARKKSVELPML